MTGIVAETSRIAITAARHLDVKERFKSDQISPAVTSASACS
jgi:hypothetical protein